MNCFSKKSDMEIEFQRLGKHMRNFWPVRLSLFKYSVLGIKMDTLQFSVDLLYNFLDLGWGILRGQQKFRRRDISFQNLTYGLWLRINQNNMKPGLNLAADILRKSYFFFFVFSYKEEPAAFSSSFQLRWFSNCTLCVWLWGNWAQLWKKKILFWYTWQKMDVV